MGLLEPTEEKEESEDLDKDKNITEI